MDPLRSEMRPAEALTDTERNARIEQLLLAGLDEYFTGQYEQAINLWTRVLFLDRHHDRARAYIERARSAQAESQREAEAVLHEGFDAFRDGDVERARRLIADALERGASREDAQGLLERIERLGVGQTAPPRRRRAPAAPARAPEPSAAPALPRRVPGWVTAFLLIVAAVGVLAVGFLGLTPLDPGAWPILSTASAPTAAAVAAILPDPLPVPRASETHLARSRTLSATGRLRDALAELDRIPIGDPLHADATALRTGIQRELLAVAAAEQHAARASDTPPGPPLRE